MLRPVNNQCRQAFDLGGIWRISFDPEDQEDFSGGVNLDDSYAIAIPGSWNEQLAEAGYMNYVGSAWLQTEIYLPPIAPHEEAVLRFGSVDYFAQVWVNGKLAGESGAAMLPFEVALENHADQGSQAKLVVRVNNQLPIDGPTQRVTLDDYQGEGRYRDEYLPAVRFDFFPFGGINRPVHLVVRPKQRIVQYRIRTTTSQVQLTVKTTTVGAIRLRLSRNSKFYECTANIVGGHAFLVLEVADAELWSPDDPVLYLMEIILEGLNGEIADCVSQQIGLREVSIKGPSLLLNGKSLELRGFGKHEDSPIHGRGLNLPQLVKDFALLKWLGANSVRTSHYPYAEEFLDLADELGIMVIDEVFSINLDFRKVNTATLEAHKQAVTELIARDQNRTCVIAWSLSNEPGYLAEKEYQTLSKPYWSDLFAHARALDDSRPMTHANVGYAGNDDPAFEVADIVTINRYYGWYSEPAQLDRATARLRADLDILAKYAKPIFIAEFGADAFAGQHATYDQLFTEEFQSRFIEAYWSEIVSHPMVIGGHIWNFADFRTAQHGRRVVHNLKGIFTRTREPKMAAWKVKELWAKP